MNHKISNIVSIKYGLYVPANKTGEISYLQVRQFNEEGILSSATKDFLILNEKTRPYLLKHGDVLFAGKGNRLFAWCYNKSMGPAIASSIFFVLRPDQTKVYPAYLSAILNAPQSKAALLQIGSGTNILSIRKSELGAFEIPVPSMQKQEKVAALAGLHQQEVWLAQQLIKQKQDLYTAIISKLVNN